MATRGTSTVPIVPARFRSLCKKGDKPSQVYSTYKYLALPEHWSANIEDDTLTLHVARPARVIIFAVQNITSIMLYCVPTLEFDYLYILY